jgi:6-phosphogluconolactonase
VTQRLLRVFDDSADLCAAVARDIESLITADLVERDECHVVLTGGTVGIALLRHVDNAESNIDWTRVHLWWGDERFVDENSTERNARQAEEALISRIAIPSENVHRMPAKSAGFSVDDAASAYATELSEFWGADFPHFDIVLLGVGPDAHVASLFPGLPGITDGGNTVIAVRDSPKPPPERVSLTLPSINASRRVWVVASGGDKAQAIQMGLTERDPSIAPVSAVRGSEQTAFYLDATAAAEI